MFGFFQKKTEVQQLIVKEGIEHATQRFSEIVSRKLPTKDLAYQFILEELDGASRGNTASKRFAESSGILPAQYTGALSKSVSEIDGPDGPQQLLLRLSLQLSSDRDLMAEFRCKVDDKIMKRFNLGKYSIPSVAPTLDAESESAAWIGYLIRWAKENNLPDRELIEVGPLNMEEYTGFPSDPKSLLSLAKNTRFLKDSIFEDRKWLEIDLTGTPLSDLPEEFCELRSLHVLYLWGCGLRKLPDGIGQLMNLYMLDLGNNKLTELPDSIGELTHLERLSVSGNQLTHLPETIIQLTNLTRLNLCGNPTLVLNAEQKNWMESFAADNLSIDDDLFTRSRTKLHK